MNRARDKNRVHIERLVLRGIDVPRHQRGTLQAAVEAELARLMNTDGFASGTAQGSWVPWVRAASIQLTETRDPAQLGRQIGRAIYGGIK